MCVLLQERQAPLFAEQIHRIQPVLIMLISYAYYTVNVGLYSFFFRILRQLFDFNVELWFRNKLQVIGVLKGNFEPNLVRHYSWNFPLLRKVRKCIILMH